MEADPLVPTYTDFFLPTLVALSSLGGSAAKYELDQAVIEAEGLEPPTSSPRPAMAPRKSRTAEEDWADELLACLLRWTTP